MGTITESTTKEVNATTYAWSIVQSHFNKIQLESMINDKIDRLLEWMDKPDENGNPNHLSLPSGHIAELAKIDNRFNPYIR